MTTHRGILATLLIASSIFAAGQVSAKPPVDLKLDLTVVVKDLKSDEGRIELALWRGADGFIDPDEAIAKLSVVPDDGEAMVVFPDLPPGDYALATYHDENGNGKFDRTFIGLPDEGLGFSNGAWIKLGPPSFKDAKISLQPNAKTTVISLRY